MQWTRVRQWGVGFKFENNSDHPHPPTFAKNMPPKYAIQQGSVWHTSRLKSRDFYRNMAYGPQKYGIRTPHFMPYEPFLLGVGVVFNLLKIGAQIWESAGTGNNCALSKRFPDPSPVLDKNRAPMGPEILSSTGAGVCRKAPKAFPDSSSVLDKFQSAEIFGSSRPLRPESQLSKKKIAVL